MKAFALAVAVAAGVAFSAGTADAQFRSRGSYGYSSYAAPSYVTPTYSNGVVVTSGYTPVVTPTVYPSGYSYSPSAWAPTYTNPYAYGGFYNAYAYPNSGVYVAPVGGSYRGRGWRW